MLIIAMGAIGYKRGLVEELGRLIGLIVSSTFAWSYYAELSSIALNKIDINPWVVMVFSYFLIFGVVLLVMRILTRFIHLLLLSKSTKLINRAMGFLFGAFKAALVVMIFLWAVEIAPNNKWSKIIYEESVIASSLTTMRNSLINLFNFQDPVQKGKLSIQKLMEKAEE